MGFARNFPIFLQIPILFITFADVLLWMAGDESFAAAEGAIKIAEMANKVRKNPLRVILNGLGKDAAQIISRINGFTYVQTKLDYYRLPAGSRSTCCRQGHKGTRLQPWSRKSGRDS